MKRQKLLCPFCKVWFEPESHNAFHQLFCAGNEECQRESHRFSSQKSRLKTKFEFPEKYREQQEDAKIRLRSWRLEHPKYWCNHVPRKKIQENFAAIRDIVRGEIKQIRDIVILQTAILKQLMELFVLRT